MLEYLRFLVDWFNNGIYQFFTDLTAWVIIKLTVAAINFQIMAMRFAWDVAYSVMGQIGLSQLIENAWSTLDQTSLSIANFFRIPEGINIVMNAAVTKFVLRFIPGYK